MKMTHADLGEKVLIIVPHQDDESLMCAGLIYSCIQHGQSVRVVICTNGDYVATNKEKGITRIRESICALTKLGVAHDDMIFLGYADTGFYRHESFLTQLYEEKDEQRIHASSVGGETYCIAGEKDEYHYLKIGSHAPYCRKSFFDDMCSCIQEFKPHTIITTSEFDVHGDHRSLYFFVVEALRDLQMQPILLTALVHSPAGDIGEKAWPNRAKNDSDINTVFDMPHNLSETTDLIWEDRLQFALPSGISKKDILACYSSAINPNDALVYEYLFSFAKSEELFWRIPC